jgi:tetratricopeptide (TPR) repeat protein
MRRRVLLSSVLCCVLAIAGCTASWRTQLERGEKFERQNRPAAALTIYDALLHVVPAADNQLISRIQQRREECLWRLQRPAEAFSAIQKSVEADPDNQAARLRLAEIYMAGGAFAEALEQATRVLDRDPRNADAMFLSGAVYAGTGRLEASREAFTRVLEIDPSRVQVSLALADLYNGQGLPDEARAVLTRATEAQPRNSQAWLALARLDEQQGETEAAERDYLKARQMEPTPESNFRLAQFLERSARVAEAEQVLHQVDALQPSQPSALADFELVSGRADKASRRYFAAIAAANPQRSQARGTIETKSGAAGKSEGGPSEGAPNSRSAIVARLIEADLAQVSAHPQPATDGMASVGRSSDASMPTSAGRGTTMARAHLEQYRQELDPASVGVLEAEIALAENDVATASMRAAGAVALAADSAAAHYVLGIARYGAGEGALARSEWQAAVAADEDYVPARLALAELAMRRNEFRQAEEQIKPVVRQEPGNLRALVLFGRALAAEQNFDAALSVAHRAVAVDAASPEPHMLLGDLALRQGHLATALVEFEQAVLLEPHAAEAVEGLTQVYRAGKITRPMLQRMEAVANREPRSATLLEIAGRLFAQNGWYADSQRCLRSALEVDPQRTSAAQALSLAYAATGAAQDAASAAASTNPNAAALLEAVRAQASGDYNAAIRRYEFAVRHGERTGVAANNLAWLYAQQGRELDRALALAHSAHDLAPQSPEIMDTLGVVHLARREYTQSVAALQIAKQLLARSAPSAAQRPDLEQQIQQHLALAYLNAGQSDAAARATQHR